MRPNGDRAYLVNDVPGREAILFHKGNYVPKDTKGCILPGLYFADINDDGLIDVAESTVAMNRMLNTMGNEFELYII